MPTMSACTDDEKIIPYKVSICQVLFSYISEDNNGILFVCDEEYIDSGSLTNLF
jgi:hypothetical protein